MVAAEFELSGSEGDQPVAWSQESSRLSIRRARIALACAEPGVLCAHLACELGGPQWRRWRTSGPDSPPVGATESRLGSLRGRARLGFPGQLGNAAGVAVLAGALSLGVADGLWATHLGASPLMLPAAAARAVTVVETYLAR